MNAVYIDRRSERFEASGMPVIGYAAPYPAGKPDAPHRHDCAQLMFATSNPLDLRIGTRRTVLSRGEGYLLPPGTDHSLAFSTPQLFRTAYIRADLAERLPLRNTPFPLSGFLAELLLRLVDASRATDPAQKDRRPAGNDLAAHLGAIVLDELSRSQSADPLAPDWPAAAQLWPICQRLTEAPGDSTTLAQWATTLGLAPRTIERRFVEGCGMGFALWRQRQRCAVAAARIAAGERIQRVAWHVGYASPAAFAAMFRRVTGGQPSALAPRRTPASAVDLDIPVGHGKAKQHLPEFK